MTVGRRLESGPLAELRKKWYGAVEIDPPWNFASRSMKNEDRLAANHYATMSLAEIMALPVKDVLAKDAVVFLWVTDTHFGEAFDLLKEWGLIHKTLDFYRTKDNKVSPGKFKGKGFWSRANPEQVLTCYDDDDNQMLLATQGHPGRIGKNVAKLIEAPRREHSRKLDEGRESSERLCEGPYLSLFSRESRSRWSTWGNKTSKFDRPKSDATRKRLDLL
ncbi:MT-A70 family methyltransferase [Lichenihabitans psoromatis]|uniref:MT-A70 family methyltransferase n=1 Tax=Lichenihabitans psoromatis TaxID=2528642 RepID=UPI0010385930|nr:MT-A70 family methyltransferase [Lichenihabitans psoromatis]